MFLPRRKTFLYEIWTGSPPTGASHTGGVCMYITIFSQEVAMSRKWCDLEV